MLFPSQPSKSAQRLARGLSILLVLVLVLVAVWASSVLAERTRTELVEAKRAAAGTLVRVFAASLVAPLDFGDDEGILSKLEDLRSNDQVLSAAVWRENEPRAVAELGQAGLTLPGRVPLVRVSADRLELGLAVTDPTARRVGTVLVAFTLLPELARYQSNRDRLLGVSIVLALFISAGLIALGRRRSSERPVALLGAPEPSFATAQRLALAQLAMDSQGGPHPGDVLGQYQLLTSVGEGGMGRVWAARAIGSTLQRLVAVKTAIREEDERIEVRQLFVDEARIALLVRHPNVCGVHEFGEHEGVLYQVLEWCDGASLRQALDRLPGGRMELPVAVRIIAKVCAGLHAAHELLDEDGTPLDVVHRDVSPHNILISTQGQVQVTDFGVAKAHGQLHRPTETGELKGKLAYMAPEQVTGQAVDRRADIFALGCILYEATTGHSPFVGEGALSTMYQLLSQPVVDPRQRLADYPEGLAAIVLCALAKQPADRYSTAEQLGVALESWLAQNAPLVSERTIAELLVKALGTFIREKSNRIEQALALLPGPESFPLQALGVTAAVPARPRVSDRPTLPARPAAPVSVTQPRNLPALSVSEPLSATRKPGVPQ